MQERVNKYHFMVVSEEIDELASDSDHHVNVLNTRSRTKLKKKSSKTGLSQQRKRLGP